MVPLFTSTTLFSDLGFSFFWGEEKGKKAQKERRKIPSELIKKERDENEREIHHSIWCSVCCFFLASFVHPKIEEKERQLESVPLSRFCPIIIYILIESGLKSARALVSTERKDHHHHPRGFSIIPREREREKDVVGLDARGGERSALERDTFFFVGIFPETSPRRGCHERARPTRRRKT